MTWKLASDRFFDPNPSQRAIARQLSLAAELDLPVIIHNREAHEEIYQILAKTGPLRRGGVIHCFSGDGETALRFIELGFHISFPGVVTFNKADILQEAVCATPLEFMLVETDAPFLALCCGIIGPLDVSP